MEGVGPLFVNTLVIERSHSESAMMSINALWLFDENHLS